MSSCTAMLGYCQSAALATVVETVQVHPWYLLVCHSTYRLTINGRLVYSQAVQNYTCRVGDRFRFVHKRHS